MFCKILDNLTSLYYDIFKIITQEDRIAYEGITSNKELF